LLGALFGLLALAISRLPAHTAFAVAGLTALAVLLAVGILELAPYERQTNKKNAPA
jgi:hypothetical protein